MTFDFNEQFEKMMREYDVNNMQTSLESRAVIISEYVDQAENLLTAFSEASVVTELLKNPDDPAKLLKLV